MMTLDELKNHRAHYDLYGSLVPLPAEVMNHLFDTAEAAITPVIEVDPTDPRDAVAPAPAKRTKKATSE